MYPLVALAMHCCTNPLVSHMKDEEPGIYTLWYSSIEGRRDVIYLRSLKATLRMRWETLVSLAGPPHFLPWFPPLIALPNTCFSTRMLHVLTIVYPSLSLGVERK